MPPAGRELDALVAEKVLGWVWAQDDPESYSTLFRPGQRFIVPPGVFDFSLKVVPATTDLPLAKEWWGNVPRYSTDIAAAHQVLNHLLDQGVEYEISAYKIGDHRKYGVVLTSNEVSVESDWHESLPLAICVAAVAVAP
jgi:hypothetical protein